MLSQLQFTQLLYQKMLDQYASSKHMVIEELALLGNQINVRGKRGEAFTCYTDRIYSRYSHRPEFLDAIFVHTLQTYHDLFLYDECGIEGVLPMVRNQEWLTEACYLRVACTHGGKFSDEQMEQEQMLAIPLVNDLAIVFAVNLSKGMHFLYRGELSSYAADDKLQSLYQQAKENLAPYLKQLKFKPTPIGDALEVGEGLEVSMLLLYEQWENRLAMRGSVVIAMIARDTVILVDSSNQEQVKVLRKLARELYPTLTHHISPNLFTFKNGALQLYDEAQIFNTP